MILFVNLMAFWFRLNLAKYYLCSNNEPEIWGNTNPVISLPAQDQTPFERHSFLTCDLGSQFTNPTSDVEVQPGEVFQQWTVEQQNHLYIDAGGLFQLSTSMMWKTSG